MSQRNKVLVSFVRIPKVRDEGEDFGRDLVDWCEHVLPNANQAEDLKSVLLENTDLEHAKHQLQSTRRFRWFI